MSISKRQGFFFLFLYNSPWLDKDSFLNMASASVLFQCSVCTRDIDPNHAAFVVFPRCKHRAHLSCIMRRWYAGGATAGAAGTSLCCQPEADSYPLLFDLGDTDSLFYDPLNLRSEQGAQNTPTHSQASASSGDGGGTVGFMSTMNKTLSNLNSSLSASVERNPIVLVESHPPVGVLLKSGVNADKLLRADQKRGTVFQTLMEGGYRASQLRQLGFRLETLVQAGMTIENWKKYRESVLPVEEIVKTQNGLGVSAVEVLRCLCDGNSQLLSSLELSPEEWRDLCAPELAAAFFLQVRVPASHLKNFGKAFTLPVWKEVLGLHTVVIRYDFTQDALYEFIGKCSTLSGVDIEAKLQEFEALFGTKVPRQRQQAHTPLHQQHNAPSAVSVHGGSGVPVPVHGVPSGGGGSSAARFGPGVRGVPGPAAGHRPLGGPLPAPAQADGRGRARVVIDDE